MLKSGNLNSGIMRPSRQSNIAFKLRYQREKQIKTVKSFIEDVKRSENDWSPHAGRSNIVSDSGFC